MVLNYILVECPWCKSERCVTTHSEKNWELGRDPFNQNFRKFRSKTQWIGSVQPEKFRKNGSTFWGGPLFPDGPVGTLVEWIAPLGSISAALSVEERGLISWTGAGNRVTCSVAWRFWLGALNNKGERGQRTARDFYFSRGFAARLRVQSARFCSFAA